MVKKSITIVPDDTPWEVACKLINAEYKYQNVLSKELIEPFFSKKDLRRIGLHIVNYCNAEMEET